MSERGYLDGVPLQLSSKFYPQRRPRFKEIDIHIPIFPIDALLQDEYDFSLERRTLLEVEEWEKIRTQSKQEEETKNYVAFFKREISQ